MLEELFLFLIILITSLVISSLLFKNKNRLGMFRPIVLRLAYVGVVIHELSHYFACLIVGIKPRHLKIKWRDEYFGFRSPHGSVEPGRKVSFLQGFIVAFAPLYISTWLIMLTFTIFPSSSFNPIVRVIAFLFCISLFTGAAPSTADFNYMLYAFKLDTTHTFYQIFLVCLSGIILGGVLLYTQVIFLLDVLYYLAIAGLYLFLKFSLIGIHRLMSIVRSRDFRKPTKIKFKSFTRPLYKPKKIKLEWEY